jgi:hypothetical protein
MDIYLPADFHLLHDDAVTDWRDVPAQRAKSADTRTAISETQRAVEHSVDPSWLAI